MNPDRERWNRKHAERGRGMPSIPLLRYQGRLARGTCLDVAGGTGENAVVLSLAGWKVVTCDLSDVAVAFARKRAAGLRADLLAVQADALRLPFRGPFHLIVATRFLERSIAPELARLLAPGGTLFLEQPVAGLRPEWCAAPGEFRRLFPALEAVVDGVEDGAAVFLGRRRP
jgi:SAM-dependent methyltransferase